MTHSAGEAHKADKTTSATRQAFTAAIIQALSAADDRRVPSASDLGQQAYGKLQYDLPLVSSEELHGLAGTLRESVHVKSGQPPLPLTLRLLENVLAGARPPAAAAVAPQPAATAAQHGAPGSSGPGASSIGDSNGTSSSNAAAGDPASHGGGCGSNGSSNGSHAPVPAAAGTAGPATTESAAPPSQPDPSLLTALQAGDRQQLCTAYRSVCAVLLVQLVSYCLAASEQDAWALLHGVGASEADGEEGEEGRADSGDLEQEQEGRHGAAARAGGGREQERLPSDGSDPGVDAAASKSIEAVAAAMAEEEAAVQRILSHQDGSAARPDARLYEEQEAAEEDGDDYEFEELEAAGSSSAAEPGAAAVPSAPLHRGPGSSTPHAPLPPSPPPPPPYSWPALRRVLLHLGGHVSYALLDEPGLWVDGQLLQGIFRLLRALGAHRHAQELAPLLHAYVGLVADRIAAEPAELACLDSLWDAVGVPYLASMPQAGKERRPGGAPGGRGAHGQGLLLAEASTCLSLVASLAGQLTGGAARSKLWQQVHAHMLRLLERCLSELSRMVAAPAQAGAGRGQQEGQQQQQQERQGAKAPGPAEVAAIVLVCQVLDFYVQQRPGNVDLGAALKGSGVLASLSVLFAAAGGLPGAEPLRSAALCCAASGSELHAWMLAVPGVAKTLAGPEFREAGLHEAHGSVWELLGGGGASPLALSILSAGATPEKAVRVHALLQLLSKAAACRRGGPCGGGLWGAAVDRALRELFAGLRSEQGALATGALGARGLAGGEVRAAGESSGQGADEPAGLLTGQEGGGGGGDGGVEEEGEEDDDDDDAKLQLLDPAALLRRRARQLHPACWRILKQLVAAGGGAGKTD
ncbi:hypothetical protein TSOC_000795 [Tetrabaena socialis]|uniref:Uncharacterized protein n=1 Tax=Tetrabaena socialis TaxID=47790 RepID=A0A2J8AIG3_9CHLO|nr:hypothetical protein TSOC_000795 [Tetrabaena socialis]|eukprot:PNH12310.1 hypothetical protein TSOC_000795 [Tetrabaena socialis]